MALVVSICEYVPFCVEGFVSIKIDIFKAHLQQEMMVNLTSLSLNFDHLKNDETDCSNCLMSREEAQWLSGRVLSDSRPRGRWFKPHRHHYVVSLSNAPW